MEARPFRVCTLNCNSIRAAANGGLIPWLVERGPDVLALQETRCPGDDALRLLRDEAGYHAGIRVGRRPGYAGVAIACRVPGRFEAVDLGLPELDAEGRLLRAELPGGLTVLSAYVPSGTPRLAPKLAFLEALVDRLASMRRERENVILSGDLNVAHLPLDVVPLDEPRRRVVGFLPEERALLDRLASVGFTDVVRAGRGDQSGPYTWHPAGKPRFGWRIDHIWVSGPIASRVRRVWVDDVRLSDHRGLWVALG